MTDRLAASFSETFPLDRSRLETVLQAALKKKEAGLSKADLAETNLGVNMRPVYLNWLYGTGLGLRESNDGTIALSLFGRVQATRPTRLSDTRTQWLMHYHLSASQGPGPLFWHQAITRFFEIEATFEKSDWLSVSKRNFGANLSDSTISHAWDAFTKTYSGGALKELGLLIPAGLGKKPTQYQFTMPFVGLGSDAFAFVLVDHWEREWNDSVTVGIDRLYESGGLAQLLFLTTSQIDEYLTEMVNDGWIDIYRVAPPYQIARRWDDFPEQKLKVLRKIYGDGSI